MTCREASNLLPLFLDGELDSRQMRSVAMHSMHCHECEAEIKGMERVQVLVSDTLKKQVSEIDFTQLWPNIERQIADARVPWTARARAWWEDVQAGFGLRIPAFVAAAAVAALAFSWYARQPGVNQPFDAQQVATADSEAALERLETTFDTIDFFNDPASDAVVVWVSDEGPLRGAMP